MFTSIKYDPAIAPSIARINRETGELSLNPKLWDRYTPEQKHVILLHEQGHFMLQTPSEVEANRHAISEFLQQGELTDQEFGRRITVLSTVLKARTPETDITSTKSPYSDNPIILPLIALGTTIFGGALNIFGQNAAKKREEAQIKAQIQLAQIQAEQQKNILIISAVAIVFIMVLLIVIFKVRKNAK